jgi:hypothetical protein
VTHMHGILCPSHARYGDRGALTMVTSARGFSLPTAVRLDVFDEDEMDADDHIGTGILNLGPELQEELMSDVVWAHDVWITVISKAGKPTGAPCVHL